LDLHLRGACYSLDGVQGLRLGAGQHREKGRAWVGRAA
jgi:hypothetical protein